MSPTNVLVIYEGGVKLVDVGLGVGSWALAGTPPRPLVCPAAVIHDGALWVIGGCTTGAGPCTTAATVYSAPIRADGSLGTFTTLTSLPAARAHLTAAVGNGAHVLGGDDTGNANRGTSVLAAPNNPDNTLGAWGVSRPLANGEWRASARVVGDWMFVLQFDAQVAKLRSRSRSRSASRRAWRGTPRAAGSRASAAPRR